MRRRTFDALMVVAGLALTAVLLVEIKALQAADAAAMRAYAGQTMTTGAQAQAYADHFIAVHLREIGGGLTYGQLSAKAMADPTNTKLADQVATVFKGTTLRGMLLNAYGFWTIGQIALIGAFAAFAGAALLLILTLFGVWHLRRVPETAEVFGKVSHPARVRTA